MSSLSYVILSDPVLGYIFTFVYFCTNNTLVFIHVFNKYLFIAHQVPRSILGTWNTWVNETKILIFTVLTL